MAIVKNLALRLKNAVQTILTDPTRYRILMVPSRHASVYVDHEVALKYSAYFRGVSYISQTVAVTAGQTYTFSVWLSGFTDPNRHVGGFYSTIAGATPNATFTGAIVAGVLTVTSISGTLNQYDAITWSGQTTSDFIKSFGTGSGGIGTYNLAGTESVGSIAMKSYTTGQFIAACRLQVKPTWNTNLTATAFNAYMFAGFTT